MNHDYSEKLQQNSKRQTSQQRHIKVTFLLQFSFSILGQSMKRVRLNFRRGPICVQWGLCEYVIVHTILGGSPVILWISLGGKPKWLPLIFGYHDVLRTSPIWKETLYISEQLRVAHLTNGSLEFFMVFTKSWSDKSIKNDQKVNHQSRGPCLRLNFSLSRPRHLLCWVKVDKSFPIV